MGFEYVPHNAQLPHVAGPQGDVELIVFELTVILAVPSTRYRPFLIGQDEAMVEGSFLL